jgi:hypothetical protein
LKNTKEILKSITHPRKELLVKISLSVVFLCIFLVLTEVVLQNIIPLNDGTASEYRIPHPLLGWTLEPHARYYNTLREETVYVQYNSKGFHDIEHTIDKAEKLFRILILGDTFMEASSVNLDESFSSNLERLFYMRGYTIEVINLGVNDYGTLQEYLAFQEVGKQFGPDLVLLGFVVADDVVNNSLELESIIRNERNRPFLNMDYLPSWEIMQFDYTSSKLLYEKIQAQRNTISRQLISKSIILDRTFEEIERIISRLKKIRQKTLVPHDKYLKDVAKFGIHYCVEPPEYTRAWNITKRILSQLKSDVEAINGRLVVFTVPTHLETGYSAGKRNHGNALESEQLCIEETPGYKRLHSILTELEIDFIDLLPDFREAARDNGVELFRRSRNNWNPEGHYLAANRVLKELINKKFVK